MQTNVVTRANFTGIGTICVKPSHKNPYIYNQILNMTRDFKIPANFHTDRIEIPSPPKSVLAKLKELAISYTKIK